MPGRLEVEQAFLKEFFERAVSITPNIIIGCALFILVLTVGWLSSRLLRKLEMATDAAKRPTFQLLLYINRIVWIWLALITALGSAGVDVRALVAGLGITGIAATFAMKDTLSNIIAGMNLMLYHAFEIGDTVSVKGCQGVVVRVNLRHTCLRNGDEKYLIPNSTMMTETICIQKNRPKMRSEDL